MNVLDKKKLLHNLTVRYETLKDISDRDFNGGLSSIHEAVREVKRIKEEVERGVYDASLWLED